MTDTRPTPHELQQRALTLIDRNRPQPDTPNHTPDNGHDQDDDDGLSGWEPADIQALLQTDLTIPPPTLHARTDGITLLYQGKIHAYNGEPESGKSWAAQHACTQTLAAGGNVCYLDFEDSPQSVLGRLISLGATHQQLIGQFTYIQPDQPLGIDAYTILRRQLAANPPQLAVIDGVTEAMSTLGYEPLDNTDTAKFFKALPRPLARHGAAVILVDHVVKDKDNRGRWALGSQHKMAALTGAAYSIEVAVPFGRNKHGIAKITVTKDRPGWVRQHTVGQVIAELHINSTDDQVHIELTPPTSAVDTETGAFRPTVVMERISQLLAHGPALTGRAVRSAVRSKDETVIHALELLVAEGHIHVQPQGRARYYSHIRPYPTPEPPETPEDDEPY